MHARIILKMLILLAVVVVEVVSGGVEGRKVVGKTGGFPAGEDRGSVGQSVYHIQGLRRDAFLTTTEEEDERDAIRVKHSGHVHAAGFFLGRSSEEWVQREANDSGVRKDPPQLYSLLSSNMTDVGGAFFLDPHNKHLFTEEEENDLLDGKLRQRNDKTTTVPLPPLDQQNNGEYREQNLLTTQTGKELEDLDNSMNATDEGRRDRANATLSHDLRFMKTTGEERSSGSYSSDPLLPRDTDEGESRALLTPRFMGIDVGDESTNFQAGMWLLGLVVMLASAIPAVFLDTTLGYRSFTSKHLYEGDINRDVNYDTHVN